ncbi:MAG: exo-beta-N-acetylmuramidase NamZ domain-containing protein [bacterium]
MSKSQVNLNKVKPGVEVFLEDHLETVKGKRIGLVTNPTGVDSNLESIISLFYKNPGINLISLYGPEHGIRGNAQAGEYVPFYMDEKYRIPVFSLYGQSKKPPSGMLKDIDEYMRSFDTKKEGKIPEISMIESIDVLIFDIQDVGTRIYTYIATMSFCMQACAENGIDFMVLDRPNPINGNDLDGPLIDYPEYSTFVGLYPIPVRHGMTIGELALLFNDRFLEKRADLKVIPMRGWKRGMWYDETTLPWIMPSPNMPVLDTATVYPGQVYLEGTNLSEGRGTTKPFEIFGAPWIDGYELAKRLNALEIPGIIFREAWFTPAFSKYKGELCGGVQIHIIDRGRYRPFETMLNIIRTIMNIYRQFFIFHTEYFDRIIGTPRVREALEKGIDIKEIVKSCQEELDNFSDLRRPYLLY